MKICYIGDAQSIHIKRWTTWFANRGYDVHLITDRPDTIEGVEVHTVKLGRNPITFISEAIQVKKLVHKIKPDILHAHYVSSYGFFGAFAKWHPFVVTGWGADILIEPYKIPPIKYLVRYVLKNADYVTVFSEYLLKNVEKILNSEKNIEVITPWKIGEYIKYTNDEKLDILINNFRKEMDIQNNFFVVLSPRNMQPVYRIEKIIEAIPIVIEKHPRTLFIFLKGNADEKYFKKIKTNIEYYSIEENVRIVERWLNEREMVGIYKLSDIAVSIPKKDQFSATVRESMLYSVVPIISDLLVYRDVLVESKNVFFVSGEDSREIADKIIHCIENNRVLEEIRKRNKEAIIQYDKTERKLDKIEKIYEELLNVRKA